MTDTPDPDAPADAPVDRTLTWAPLLGAAAVAAVVLLVLVLAGPGSDHHLGTATDATARCSCPATYEVASQAVGADQPLGRRRGKALVADPEAQPRDGLPLQDLGLARRHGDARLDGHRTLTGDLAAVTRCCRSCRTGRFAGLRGADASDGGSYLLGSCSPTGDVWILGPRRPVPGLDERRHSPPPACTANSPAPTRDGTWAG